VFPEDELKLYKQTNKQRLEVNLKKCEFVANRLIDKYLFGADHPYGRFSTAEALDAISREQLVEFHKKFYQQGKCIIFVAGKLPGDLVENLNRHFGKLDNNAKEIIASGHLIQADPEKKKRIINDPTGVQGAIRLATHFPNRHHPDFMKVQVLNNIFGGFFGSRLMGNIREDKGYTYGIHSYLQNHIHQSAWIVSTEAGRDVSEATIAEVYKEMEVLREEVVDEEELLLVRNYMMGTILAELDGPFQIMAKWKNIIINNLGENFFYDSIQTIKTIPADELRELARKYLHPDRFYELVVI
jgi:predicted Zn-dependent peptidase